MCCRRCPTRCSACARSAATPTFLKQLTAAGFQLKGSGWYVTDFRDGASKPAAKPADGAQADTPSSDAPKTDAAAPAPAPDSSAKGESAAAPAPAPAPAAPKTDSK